MVSYIIGQQLNDRGTLLLILILLPTPTQERDLSVRARY
jgi:hypothetical protein